MASSSVGFLTEPQKACLARGLDLLSDVDSPGVRMLGLSLLSPNRKWKQLDETIERLQELLTARKKSFPFHHLNQQERAVLGACFVSSDWFELEQSAMSCLPKNQRLLGIQRVTYQVQALEKKLKAHGIPLIENAHQHKLH